MQRQTLEKPTLPFPAHERQDLFPLFSPFCDLALCVLKSGPALLQRRRQHLAVGDSLLFSRGRELVRRGRARLKNEALETGMACGSSGSGGC